MAVLEYRIQPTSRTFQQVCYYFQIHSDFIELKMEHQNKQFKLLNIFELIWQWFIADERVYLFKRYVRQYSTISQKKQIKKSIVSDQCFYLKWPLMQKFWNRICDKISQYKCDLYKNKQITSILFIQTRLLCSILLRYLCTWRSRIKIIRRIFCCQLGSTFARQQIQIERRALSVANLENALELLLFEERLTYSKI